MYIYNIYIYISTFFKFIAFRLGVYRASRRRRRATPGLHFLRRRLWAACLPESQPTVTPVTLPGLPPLQVFPTHASLSAYSLKTVDGRFEFYRFDHLKPIQMIYFTVVWYV
jgi:hypothetical protein